MKRLISYIVIICIFLSAMTPLCHADSLTLGVDLDTIMDCLGTTYYEEYTFTSYRTDKYTISKAGSNSSGIVAFSLPGQSEVSAVLFLSYAGASASANHRRAAETAQESMKKYCEVNMISSYSDVFEIENTKVYAVYADGCGLNVPSLPISLKAFRESTEFFSDTDRQTTYLDYLNSCKYTELYNYIETFISNNTITENEVITTVLENAKTLSSLLEKCDVDYDQFKNQTTIYFKGHKEISPETCIVPMLIPSSYGFLSLNYILGFMNTGWVFFDEVSAVSNDQRCTYQIESYDVIRDVVGNGIIREYVYSDNSDINKVLLNATQTRTAAVRFSSSDSHEYYDHNLTTEEIDAFETLWAITRNHLAMSSVFQNWKDK